MSAKLLQLVVQQAATCVVAIIATSGEVEDETVVAQRLAEREIARLHEIARQRRRTRRQERRRQRQLQQPRPVPLPYTQISINGILFG